MARVKISGFSDEVLISNERAIKLTEDKKNMPMTQQRETWIEIGSWQGYLSKVTSVLVEKEREYPEVYDYSRPLTPLKKMDRERMMMRVRKNLEEKGILKPLNFSADEGKCKECKCLLKRVYICRHNCKKCIESNL